MKTARFQALLSVIVALASAGMLSNELQAKSRENKVKTTPISVKYVAKNIGKGGGIIDLVDSNTKELVGVSNFRSNRLDIGNVFVFDKIRVYVATDKEQTEPDKVDYLLLKSAGKILKVSELEIYTNGKKIISIPLSAIASNQETECHVGLDLASPGYLVDGAEFEIKLKMPSAFDTDDNHFVKVELEGVETYI